MSSKYVLIVSLFCVLLTSYVQCQTNEESEDPSEGQESTGNEEEPQSMADAYLDYISGGHKADGESSQFDDIGEGLDQAMEGSGPTEDSSTMDMLLQCDDPVERTDTCDKKLGSFKSEFKGLKESEVKKKLGEHVKEMDLDGDSKVSEYELSKWITKQAEKGAMAEDVDQLGLDVVDTDKNKKVTWQEVVDDLRQYSSDTSNDTQFQKDIKFEKLKFEHADKDEDKVLNREEYAKYLMPEYFSDMVDYALKQYILEYDQDDDWLISLPEFLKDLKESLDKEAVKMETDRFNKMDKDKDGKLSKDEVREVALEFNILTMANTEAKKLILTVDQNKDGVLSHAEIVANYPTFTKGDALDDLETEQPGRHDEL